MENAHEEPGHSSFVGADERRRRKALLSVHKQICENKRVRSPRLCESDLVNSERHLKKRNVEEFLIHGLRYMFPLKATGELVYGMPTSYAAPVSADEFAISGNVPVWRSSKGKVLGRSHEPIYPTVPDAAAEDPELYDRIAVLDMLRGGRLRERRFAEQKIKEYLA